MTRRTFLAAGVLSSAAVQAQSAPTLAERLGFSRDARVLMLHADDVGMCHSVNTATAEAFAEGLVTTGSVMVPCPWFPEIADWSKQHPEWDLGLHLTLTSEWRFYRWGPTAPREKVPTLLDPEGFLWRSVADVKKHASPEHVELEIRAQIERARQFGMQ